MTTAYNAAPIALSSSTYSNVFLDPNVGKQAIDRICDFYKKEKGLERRLGFQLKNGLVPILKNSKDRPEGDRIDPPREILETYGHGQYSDESLEALAKQFSPYSKLEVPVKSIRVVQESVQVQRMLWLMGLSDGEFQQLCYEQPVSIIGTKMGPYMLDGNHRLLSAQMRGFEKLPGATSYVADENDDDLQMLLRDGLGEHESRTMGLFCGARGVVILDQSTLIFHFKKDKIRSLCPRSYLSHQKISERKSRTKG